MAEQTMANIQRKARNVVIGKIILLLILGALAGYFIDASSRADYEKGKHLTREEYIKNYEAYKAELTETKPPGVAISIAGACLMLFPVFGLYELGGKLCGAVAGWAANVMEGKPGGTGGDV